MDIKDASLYKPTQKKEYVISARIPAFGTKVHNKLELADYVTDEACPVVLTGTVGEEWVVAVEKLLKTYTHADGSPITAGDIEHVRESGESLQVRTLPGVQVFAMFVPVSMKPVVYTSRGDMLIANADGVEHGDGDYIACSSKDGQPNTDDMWVINGLVFQNTYTPIA